MHQNRVLVCALTLAAVVALPPISCAFSPSTRLSRAAAGHAKSMLLVTKRDDDGAVLRRGSENDDDVTDARRADAQPTRRDALGRASLLSLAAAACSIAVGPDASANAADLPNFLLPRDRRTDDGVYKQAKRATAYLVDSTIPPSLVPFRASREAAVLKGLGQGSGTSKDPYLQEQINLNNMMNKGVFGAARLVGDLVRGGPEERRSGRGYASFVFLGVDLASAEDADLAAGLLTDVVRPRRDESTALGLAFAPQSAQGALDRYLRGEEEEEASFVESLVDGAGADRVAVETYLPLMRFAKSKGLALLALAPEVEDVRTVRTEGLQNVNIGRRSDYVVDAEGFINLTQDPEFRLYTEKSLLKDFDPQSEKDSPGDFFAERIMVHEAVATAAARWAVKRPDSLVAVVAPKMDVRFLGGPNGRVPRVCRFLDPDSIIDKQCVTTILLNPSAKETLSQSKFLRLEIGTAPDNLQYQTKVADYLWFSRMPKVNMLPRMMNYA